MPDALTILVNLPDPVKGNPPRVAGRKLYEESFKKPAYTKTFTEKMHRAEFDKLDRDLRKALTARWDEDSCGGNVSGRPKPATSGRIKTSHFEVM